MKWNWFGKKKKGPKGLTESFRFRITPAEKLRIEHVSSLRGTHPEAWVRDVIVAALPQITDRDDAGVELEAVRLLTEEFADTPPITSDPPAAERDQAREELRQLPRVTGHPCEHLRDLLPPGMPQGFAMGVCTAPVVTGKVCRWGKGVAPQCEDFAPYRRGRKVIM